MLTIITMDRCRVGHVGLQSRPTRCAAEYSSLTAYWRAHR
jgi:hypothetical protein